MIVHRPHESTPSTFHSQISRIPNAVHLAGSFIRFQSNGINFFQANNKNMVIITFLLSACLVQYY